MREMDSGSGDSARTDAETRQETAYGCVFCTTGKERQVAGFIQTACPGVRALTMRQTKYRTHNKVKTREDAIVLPSYVFFSASPDLEPRLCFPRQELIRVLTHDGGQWQLAGEDERFAKWLFQYDGLLGFSKAYKEGDKIRIVSGPLKDMEGKIIRVDRRGCSGQVVLSFRGKDIPVWLGFEYIDALSPDGMPGGKRPCQTTMDTTEEDFLAGKSR